uniref:DUF7734 domain-containing protein n=1 Tax=Chenopodium quinoa TaxID=63459 RepID=A0A803MTK1_CHEQI
MKNSFINGLKDEIKRELRMWEIESLGRAMQLTARIEEKYRGGAKGNWAHGKGVRMPCCQIQVEGVVGQMEASFPLMGCLHLRAQTGIGTRPVSLTDPARRRVRYDKEDYESYGYNEEIAILEMYSQSARGEALLVTAMVDDQQVEVLIFKGFSSCLSYGTSPDPSKSVLPQRARIMSIDRIKGPFNPNNIEYIEKGLTWETFKSRFASTNTNE